MKCVLITGAARNTGLGMARLFAKRGWSVICTSRSEAQAQEAARSMQAETGMPCLGIGHDIGDLSQTQPLFDRVMAAEETAMDTLTAAERAQFLALCRRYNAALRQSLSTAIEEKKE